MLHSNAMEMGSEWTIGSRRRAWAKRSSFLWGLLLVIFAAGQAPGAITIDPQNQFGVLTTQPSLGQYGFDFDGRFVVWRDIRGGERSDQGEIFAFDLLTRHEFQLSSPSPAQKIDCKVSNGIVIWLEEGDGTEEGIYARDLTGRLWPKDDPPRKIAPHTGSAGGMDIDGDWVVWTEGIHDSGGDIFALNLRTQEQVTVSNDPATEWGSVISCNIILWTRTPGDVWGSDMDWDVYGYDLNTGATFPVKVGPGNFYPGGIDGGRGVLNEGSAYGMHDHDNVWMVNLNTGEEKLIATNADTGSIAGATIVYHDLSSDRVRGYDLRTSQDFDIAASPSGGPRIHGLTVVWSDGRPPANGNRFIYGTFLGPKLDADGHFDLMSAPNHYAFDFDGRFIVWRLGDEIDAYDMLTQTTLQVSEASGANFVAHVSNGIVSWANDSDKCIYVRDLTGRLGPIDQSQRLVATSARVDIDNDIDGDWMTWVTASAQVRVKNLRTQEEFTIANPPTGSYPSISGNILVMNGSTNVYDLNTRIALPIVIGPGNFLRVRIDETRVVYGTSNNIFVTDILTSNTQEQLIGRGADYGSISGALAGYRDESTGKDLIFDLMTGKVIPVTDQISFDPMIDGITVVWPNPDHIGFRFLFGAEPPVIANDKCVFDQNGDIWLMDLNGSNLVQLTSGSENDSYPRFNHAGTRIAFCSDRGGQYQVWTMRPDGSDVRLVEGFQSGNPLCLAWSPDDREFVIGSMGDKFWIVEADGSGNRQLTQHALTQAREVDWSTSNTIVMMISPFGDPSTTSIRTILPGGGGDQEIVPDGADPSWSPDGTKLLYTSQGDLWNCQPDGSNKQKLTATAETEAVPCWAANGEKIIYRSYPTANPAISALTAANANGSSPVQIYSANSVVGSVDAAVVRAETVAMTNHPPRQPINVSPANNATAISLTTTLTASAFSDPDSTDTHRMTQWQVRRTSETYQTATVDIQTLTELISFQIQSSVLVKGQDYAWRVRYFDNNGNVSSWSDETTFRTVAPSTGDPGDKIIIVAGGGEYMGNSMTEQTKFLAGYAYRLSLFRKIPKEKILLLSAFDPLDVGEPNDPTHDNDVNQPATKENLHSAIATWAAGTNKLIVYLVDHGRRNTETGNYYFRLNAADETVSAQELDVWLDAAQTANPNMKVAMVGDFCYSGGFVTQCQPTYGQSRICISGSTDDSFAAFIGTDASISFSNFFFDSLLMGNPFKSAFDVAREGVLAADIGPPIYPLQVPWLEDNGDGHISDKNDGVMAANFYWGWSAAIGAGGPEILEITPDQTLPTGASTVQLSVTLTADSSASEVWATIIPPNASYSADNPVTDIIRVSLVATGGKGRNISLQSSGQTWSAVYSGFTQIGAYHVTFYAQGSDGLISSPRAMTIVTNNGEIPTANAVKLGWTLYQ